jgi:hypothetical protein
VEEEINEREREVGGRKEEIKREIRNGREEGNE